MIFLLLITYWCANIKDILTQLQYQPNEVLSGKENEGPYGVLNYLEKLLK